MRLLEWFKNAKQRRLPRNKRLIQICTLLETTVAFIIKNRKLSALNQCLASVNISIISHKGGLNKGKIFQFATRPDRILIQRDIMAQELVPLNLI